MTWARRHRVELCLATPLVAFVLLFTVAPILDTARLSLTSPLPDGRFPSLTNYRAIFASDLFRTAAVNTVAVALLSVLLELAGGLAVAVTLHRRFPLRGVARTLFLLPLGVPTIVAGAVMLLIFSRAGYLNALLWMVADAASWLPGVDWHFAPPGWTVAGGWRTLFVVAVADTWKVLPVVTLVLLAGLQSIPAEAYEAADVDGANAWQRFSRITLPLLMPYVTIAVVLRAIDAFRIFELALVLAGRVEPVLATFIWSRYGPPTHDAFTAAAAAMVLFGVIAVFVGLYLRLVRAAGEEPR
jgi:trehalose transport system permease protein